MNKNCFVVHHIGEAFLFSGSAQSRSGEISITVCKGVARNVRKQTAIVSSPAGAAST